jgi:membrane-bound lytic murein transglycosylase D
LRRAPGGGTLVALGMLASACAHGRASVATELPNVSEARPQEDRTAALIAEADTCLATGIAQLKDGHLTSARESFDRAIDAYLTAPGGAYATPKLGDAYRRTLETIHLREVEALAAGDGFAETQPEPASIDEVGEMAVADWTPSEDTRRTAEEAVRQETNDFPVVLNNAVLSCVDLYQGRLRDWFSAALTRGSQYLPRIRQIFAEEGVPQDLAYLAMVESAFRPAALSRARAKGVWQFISETGRRYGLQQDWWVDERSDPDKATRAAARYLRELYGMFSDWNLAMAAYNSGEATVAKGIARYGTKDFWELSRTRTFRRETKNYVPLIHAAIVVAKAPEKYGFSVTPEAAPEAEKVPVQGAVDLRVIAECVGGSVDQVRALNPELRRLSTPAGRTFEVKVPAGAGETLTRCLASVPQDKRVQFRTHVVARGQTLYTIARRYGTRSQDIASANGLAAEKPLAVGSELIIPIQGPGRRAPAMTIRPATRTASNAVAATPGPVRVSYRVRPGDTLESIATQYGTTIRDLQSWNGLHTTRIAAGNTLTIYTTRKF